MEIVFIYLTEVIYKLWAICVTSANNHHKHSPDGLSWWIIWDLLERAKGKLTDKNQQQLISSRILKSETYISLVSTDAQLQILLLCTAKENTHEGLVVSIKT